MSLTQADLEDIEARCNAATPGPWKHGRYDGRGSIGRAENNLWEVAKHVCCGQTEDGGRDCSGCGPIKKVDLDFIANARQDMPRLLADLKEARQILSDVTTIDPDDELGAAAFLRGGDGNG